MSQQEGKITKEELRNVLKAMDKEGFDALMGDYIKEISNPENVKETNQYLKQAEETNDLPKNVKLAKPVAGFCLKSSKINLKRPSARQKVYINIVYYEGVKAPAKDPNQQICKREKKPNSRFTTKTCFTRAQWAEMAEVNKRAYAESRDRPTIEIRRDTGVIGSPR